MSTGQRPWLIPTTKEPPSYRRSEWQNLHSLSPSGIARSKSARYDHLHVPPITSPLGEPFKPSSAPHALQPLFLTSAWWHRCSEQTLSWISRIYFKVQYLATCLKNDDKWLEMLVASAFSQYQTMHAQETQKGRKTISIAVEQLSTKCLEVLSWNVFSAQRNHKNQCRKACTHAVGAQYVSTPGCSRCCTHKSPADPRGSHSRPQSAMVMCCFATQLLWRWPGTGKWIVDLYGAQQCSYSHCWRSIQTFPLELRRPQDMQSQKRYHHRRRTQPAVAEPKHLQLVSIEARLHKLQNAES